MGGFFIATTQLQGKRASNQIRKKKKNEKSLYFVVISLVTI
jgi:hypothetical protein